MHHWFGIVKKKLDKQESWSAAVPWRLFAHRHQGAAQTQFL
jgi:hypothetical protein